MVNISDLNRNAFMLKGALSECGYDWWWHSFTGRHSVTGEEKAFFIEFFTCNPALGGAQPILGQLPDNQRQDRKPSYLMVKVGAWGEDAVQLHRFFGWDSVSAVNMVSIAEQEGSPIRKPLLFCRILTPYSVT